MKIKIKIYNIIMFIVFSLGLSCFNLFDEKGVFGISIDDIGLVVAAFWGLFIWYKLKNIPNPKFEYKWWCISVCALVLFSSLQSHLLFGQPLFLGIRVQRAFLIWSLLYFPLQKAISCGWFKKQDIQSIVRCIGIIELILFISQYFLYDKVVFLYTNVGERYDDLRFYFQPIWIDLMLIMELDNYVNTGKKKEKIKSVILIMLSLFEVMVVQKFRLTSMALIICIVMGLLIAKGKVSKRLYNVVLIGIILAVLYNTTLVQDVLSELFNESSNDSTLSIREQGRELYLNTLLKHPILGGGFPHEECLSAYRAAGVFKNIFLVDNGVFGFAYIYGGVGCIWLITLWGKMLSKGIKILKNSGRIFYFIFPLFFVITATNEAHWYWMNGFMVLVLFLTLQSENFQSESYKKENDL